MMLGAGLQIRQVRIDVPLRQSYAYLFVGPEFASWDPWWMSLYQFLVGMAPQTPDWRHEPELDVVVARARLGDAERTSIVEFLRSAPARELEEHRTLRRASELTPEQVARVELLYFAERMESAG
jgi:hypothetical protein